MAPRESNFGTVAGLHETVTWRVHETVAWKVHESVTWKGRKAAGQEQGRTGAEQDCVHTGTLAPVKISFECIGSRPRAEREQSGGNGIVDKVVSVGSGRRPRDAVI
ncbi:hypothetical protein E2C01_011383 [Portunus trituberculatus]|uniref:Uncharacterized protein n=1 Tax=Portunus trituberculatus TaxID=210409 RepID=A0A5B7DB57_PORTR|nr:hypothetical protein [Portunus trituberculatus]